MIQHANEQAAAHFPRREVYVDCRGIAREFIVDFVRDDDQRFLKAVEAVDSEGRYEFAAMSETDPYLALGKLRQTIRRELSTRYLHGEDDVLELAHDELRGRIEYGGVAVDGQFVSFDALLRLLEPYEGFHFQLRITDPADL
jgi:hypothetical protein